MKMDFRRPKTTQEKRLNSDPDHQEYVRGKRRGRNLPDAWDDKHVGSSKESPKKVARSKNNFRNTIRKD